MRAIGFTEFGGPEVLREFQLPDPVAGPGEVRVRVAASAVNPTDTLRRSGVMAALTPLTVTPFVPGMDFAGYLEEFGPGGESLLVEGGIAVGARVMGAISPRGTNGAYASQVVVPAGAIVRVPDTVELTAASTLPMNGLTARTLIDVLALERGATLAVTGAAGTLGSYVVSLAVRDGLTVIADASDADRAAVAALGVAAVVARGDDVADRFRTVAPTGVDGLVDCALLDEKIVPAVKEGGVIGTVRSYVGPPVNGISYRPVRVRHHVNEGGKLAALRDLVEEGVLTLRVLDVQPAEHAAEVHRRLEAGGTRGRIVLVFPENA